MYEKTRAIAQKYGAKVAAVPALVMGFAGSALAEVPTEVTTALGDAKTDGIAIATLVLVAIIAIFAFKLMRKGL